MKYNIAAVVSICALVLLTQSLSHAGQPPSAEEIRRVTGYFYDRQASTPVLVVHVVI